MKRKDGSPVTVRMSTPLDVERIARLLLESFIEYEASYTEGGFKATTPTAEQLRNRFDEGPVWVAVQAGEIVGTVAVVSRGEDLYIRSMAVRGAARGQGIGNLLLKEVEKFALARTHKRMVLSTTPFLARAIRLYEQAGFRRTDDGPHDLFGTPLFTMSKSLLEP